MLGRLLTRWSDIMGDDLASKTQPVKIRYFKSKVKGEKAKASLDIGASTADSTLLHYKKDLILERINQLFGENWITSIKFVPYVANEQNSSIGERKKRRVPLSPLEKKSLNDVLNTIDDEDIRKKLEKLGTSVLQDQKNKL